MTLALIIYLVFTALPAISKITMMAFLVWLVCSVIGIIVGAINREVEGNRGVWDGTVNIVVKGWYKAAIACLLVSLLIPNKEVTAYMLAGYGVQTVAQNEQVQELAGDGLDVLQQLMKKAKSSLEEEVKESE